MTRPAIVPDAFLAGFPKCATTWLARALSDHPDVCVTQPKEPNYWVRRIDPSHDAADIPIMDTEAYNASYANPHAPVLVDGSVILSDKHDAARRLAEEAGGPTKAIFMVRDPADRLWSDVCYEYACGRLPQLPAEPSDVPHHLVERGHYARVIEQWRDAGWDVCVLDLAAGPGRVWDAATRFLRLSVGIEAPSLWRRVRPGAKRVQQRKDRVIRLRPPWWTTHWRLEYGPQPGGAARGS